jgi:UDP-N-acetylmuramate dehydrogenase
VISKPDFIEENVSTSPLCTYKTGGMAKYYCRVRDRKGVIQALDWSRSMNLNIFVLGKGSNLVVSDTGYSGLILHIDKHFSNYRFENNRVICQSGALLQSIVTQSVRKGLAGIQNLAGIPGSVGGGTYINAGAYDQELKNVIRKVTSIDLKGQLHVRTGLECDFSYRHSIFCELKEIILEVELELNEESPEHLAEEMQNVLIKRKAAQPLEYPNAGSMFKRPPGTFAGKLIQEAGLKGFRHGGACISPKHANFVINDRKACAQDIFDLSEEVIIQVEKNSGIRLEKEQIFLGEFLPWPR